MTTTAERMRPKGRPAKALTQLADFLHTDSPAEPGPTISGVAVGSGDVCPGDLFVALTGLRRHGAEFAADAVARGAVAILTDPAGEQRAAETGVPVLVVPEPRAVLGELSAWLYGRPGDRLTIVGVTGTNGKTTTTYFVDAALAGSMGPTALSGTVELRIGTDSIPSPRTTVESPVLHGMFAAMTERGIKACTMEVSSHALALHRVDGVPFDVAVFTNLQRDHLDFHGDMESYFRDKALLFTPERARRAVICVDDEWGRRLADQVTIPVDTVAVDPRGPDYHATGTHWRVEDISVGRLGALASESSIAAHFTLVTPDGERIEASSALPGSYNVSNAALALVASYRAGVPLADAAAAIATQAYIPGRMERVGARGEGPLAIVDYAHTPDALRLALRALRPVTPGRIIHVFGSDGDRDRGKRPIMGEISAELADVLIVTDENPRSEVPETIRAAILEGIWRRREQDDPQVYEAESRVAAIGQAVSIATSADTIVVTGKGHEPAQEIAGVFHPQLDADVLRAALALRWPQ